MPLRGNAKELIRWLTAWLRLVWLWLSASIAQRPRTGGPRTDEHQDQPHVLIPVHSPRQKTAQDYQVQVLHSAEQYPNQYEICSHPLSLQYELPLLFPSHLLRMLNYIHIVSSVS